ncbi:MAG: Spy/CpxP family protein refolding chaperone [Phycisphaerae bacterium]
MMARPRVVAWVLVCLGVGTVAYVATVASGQHAAGSGRQELYRWLELTAQQQRSVEQADASFAQDGRVLTGELRAERETLAGLLMKPDVSDDVIRAQLERVIDREVTLERRVSEFVLRIRRHLNPEQRLKLMELVAGGLRENAGQHLVDAPE